MLLEDKNLFSYYSLNHKIFNFLSNKKIGLKRSCNLKVMKFLIFRDFSGMFLNFFDLF